MNKKSFIIVALMLSLATVALAGCGDKESAAPVDTAQKAEHPTPAAAPAFNPLSGTIVETMDSGGYTYILLDNGKDKVWIAGPVTPVEVQTNASCPDGMIMYDFHSKSLDKTFAQIYFVGAIWPEGYAPSEGNIDMHGSDGGSMMGGSAGMNPHGTSNEPISGTKTVLENAKIEGVTKAAGGYTVEEIYTKAAELSGKEVTIRARVVKFSRNIMGTNWIHIQDGSGDDATSDLTITTDDTAEIGDLVMIKGPLSVDKDFGAGYKYHVIIEGASVTKE